MNGRRLYEVPAFDGQDDYLTDEGLRLIGEKVIAKLPRDGFDVPSLNATTKGVTATFHFDGTRDPMAHADFFEAVARSVTYARCLHANLVAAREALAAASRDGDEVTP